MGLLEEKLKGLLGYIEANTPRATRPVAKPSQVINQGLINPNKYNAPAANRFKDSAFGLLGVVPGVGDAASAVESADLFKRGESFAGSMAALGALPLIPSFGGIMKNSSGVQEILRDALGYISPNATISGFGIKPGTYSTPEYFSISSVARNLPGQLKQKFNSFEDAITEAQKHQFSIQRAKDVAGNPMAHLVDDYSEKARIAQEVESKAKWSNSKKVYLRYGDIPASGYSKNYRDNVDELGVSVFNGEVLPDLSSARVFPSTNHELGTFMFMNDRPLYVVDGELIGYGSDGEPLLRNAKITGKVKNKK